MQVTIDQLNDVFNRAFESPVNISIDSVRSDFDLWDSINQLNLIVELEDFYKISFSKEEIQSIDSVKRIIEIIESK